MNRKEFIKKSAFAIGAGLPILTVLSSCGSDDSATLAEANCLDNGTSVSIASNHGHALTVSKADVDAGVERVYPIAGSSTHSHNVTILSSHFQSLKQNQSISVTSTDAGHTHRVTVSCA